MALLPARVLEAALTRCRSAPHLLLFCIVFAVLLKSRPVLGKKSQPKEITDSNWEEILQGEWMIEFFAPWCPACKQLQPVWDEFAEWGDDLGINIAKVDITEQPGLSGRFAVTSLPTIYHCKDGEFRVYDGARTKDDFLGFIDEKKWQNIKPMSSWLGPSSFLMNGISAVFRLSVSIRQWHSYLTEQLGLPAWGSYVLFTLAVLFTGLALGLILVIITDFAFSSRRPDPPPGYYQRRRLLERAHLTKLEEDELEENEEEDETEEEEAGGKPELRDEDFQEESLRRRFQGPGREEEDT
ncbi:thioredoxin-related transmembrane protein 1-like [Paramormyrops kingsleyae]|uniref:Thioredoxin-related transmembrane protein 1 n=1 Tax=Paramormyrops kingsleyae TaxID=1676925 RepID=A0A3B3QI86_9TELE|nr:thioredoxin-related transmembrane protein 1-like [Paramormyrops kingsleyae]